MESLPLWAYIVGGVVAGGLLCVGLFFFARRMRKSFIRRYIVRLLRGSEGIAAGRRTLHRIITDLAEADDDALIDFASNGQNDDRHAMADLVENMTALAYELNTMPLPKVLVGIGENLADVATSISRQTGVIVKAEEPDIVFDALGALDTGAVAAAHEAAIDMLHEIGQRYDMEDAAVYGGGLYI